MSEGLKSGFRFVGAQSELVTKYVLPVRVVLSEKSSGTGVLLSETPRQAAIGACPVSCVLEEGGSVLLDYGAEMQGGVMLSVDGASPVGERSERGLRVTFGESVSEALHGHPGVSGATNDHAIRDSIVPVGFLSTFRVGMTGFRFVRLEAVGMRISLSCAQGAFDFRDIERIGAFRCSDERLNRIWDVAVNTVHLNMQEYLWDGIKRDRLVWIGDMNAEVNTVLTAFGAHPVVKKSLDFIRSVTPPTAWMNTIPSYSMWWIKDHYDWYLQTGDLAYLTEQKEYMTALLGFILSHIREDGTHSIGNAFVDWSSNNTPYMEAGLNAMLVISLEAGAELMRVLGNEDLALRCEAALPLLRRHTYEYAGNKQVAGLVSLAGIVDAKEINDSVLSVGGADGFSTFLGYCALLAKAKAGDYDGAVDVIRTYWGAMLDLGATSFWEDFDMAWVPNAARIDEPVPEGKTDVHGSYGKFCYTGFRHSLCHGWASGPATFLTRCILGVEAIEPGFAKVRVMPHLCDLDFAEGVCPTPHGPIYVSVRREGGSVVTDVRAPKGVQVV